MTSRPVPFAIAIAGGVLMLFVGCRDRQEAAAADLPKLEIKAAVGQPRTAVVTAAVDGRIDSLPAKEGATVNAGDPIVSLTNATIERDLAYTRAQLAHAEHRLRTLDRPQRRPASTNQDGERLRAAEQIVQARKTRLIRYESLYKTRDISIDELELVQAEYAAAMRDLAAEQRAVAAADTVTVTDPALLRLDVEKARAEAALVEERRKHLSVVAPIAGTITRILVSPGDSIYPRDPLLEITDVSQLDVRGTIAPELLRYIKPGTPVEVKIFTVPPRRFMTAIKSIVPAADATGPTVVVSVANPDGVLQPGTSATITVR